MSIWIQLRLIRIGVAILRHDFDHAITLADRLARSRFARHAIHGQLHLAQLRTVTGEIEEAAHQLERAALGLARLGRHDHKAQAMLHFGWAGVHRARRQHSAALAQAEEARAIWPTDYTALQHAIMLKHEGRLEEAIEILTPIAGRFPTRSLSTFVLAGFLILAGERDRGRQMLESIPEEDNIMFLIHSAWVQACDADRDGCLEFLRRAQTKDPRVAEAVVEMDEEFDRFRNSAEFQAVFRTAKRE